LRLVDRMGVNRPHKQVGCSLMVRGMPPTEALRAYASSSALCAVGPTRLARWMAYTVR
jgi:hypothetical protein